MFIYFQVGNSFGGKKKSIKSKALARSKDILLSTDEKNISLLPPFSTLALRTRIKDVLKQGYQKMEDLKPTSAKLKRKNMFFNNSGQTTLSIPPRASGNSLVRCVLCRMSILVSPLIDGHQ